MEIQTKRIDRAPHPHLRRKALAITDAELRLIANAAIIGDSSHPVSG
jgi:hypothetical protein